MLSPLLLENIAIIIEATTELGLDNQNRVNSLPNNIQYLLRSQFLLTVFDHGPVSSPWVILHPFELDMTTYIRTSTKSYTVTQWWTISSIYISYTCLCGCLGVYVNKEEHRFTVTSLVRSPLQQGHPCSVANHFQHTKNRTIVPVIQSPLH